MNYRLLLPALLLPAVWAAPTPRTSAYVGAALANQQQWLSVIRDATTLLQGITDTASADAAVPGLKTMAAQIRHLQQESAGFTTPSAEEEAAFKTAMNHAEVKQTVAAFMAALETVVQADCYHSAALSAELPKLMRADP